MSESSTTLAAPEARPASTPEARSLASRHGPAALVGAGTLGIAGDLLLREVPWGLNLLLWTLAVSGVAMRLEREAEARRGNPVWVPLALTAAAFAVWRDSPVLKALDLGALGIVLALGAWHARGGAVRLAGIAEQLVALLHALFDAWTGMILLLFQDVRWGELPRGAATRNLGAVVRGLALAVPLVTVFAVLLSSADARFERWLGSFFRWNAEDAFLHLITSVVFAWAAAGILRALALQGGEARAVLPRLPGPRLGLVETTMVLGMLNALFLAFVVLQVPYLFGTSSVVESGALNYSEYARRGFFELVAVAGLVLPVLLGLHWFMRVERPTDVYVFRGFAWLQVMLVSVIVASALHRMRLYQGAYGLTELRLYTTAFMGWIAAVLGWFCLTVLRGRRERFAFGALVAAGLTVAALHAANPDAWIVRTNLERARAGRPFDARYAASLSGDAAPVLASALPRLPAAERCTAARALERRWSGPLDWRAWSWGRSRAVAAVAGRRLSDGCPPPQPEVLPSPPRVGGEGPGVRGGG